MTTTTYEICPLTFMVTVGADKAELFELEAGVEIDLQRKASPRSAWDAGSGAEYTTHNYLVNCRQYVKRPGGEVLSGRWVDDWRPCPQALEGYVDEYVNSDIGRRDIEYFIAEEL